MSTRLNPLAWIVIMLFVLTACAAGPAAKTNVTHYPPGAVVGITTVGSFTDSGVNDLEQARTGGNTIVLAYNLLYSSKQAVHDYLNKAGSLGIKVIINAGDFVDEPSLRQSVGSEFGQLSEEDYQNIQKHKRQYGATADEQLAGLVREFQNHPALWGFLASNNIGSTTSEIRFQEVTRHVVAMKAITNKPFLVGGDAFHEFKDNDAWVREQLAFAQKMRAAGVEYLILTVTCSVTPTLSKSSTRDCMMQGITRVGSRAGVLIPSQRSSIQHGVRAFLTS